MPEVNQAYNKYSQTSLNMDRFKCQSLGSSRGKLSSSWL